MSDKTLNEIFEFVKRINPTITKQKLLDELLVSRYSTIALVVSANNKTPYRQ